MSSVTESRFCPFCEQIVPSEQKGVLVGKFPNPKKLFHDGCASLISAAYSDKHELQGKDEDK